MVLRMRSARMVATRESSVRLVSTRHGAMRTLSLGPYLRDFSTHEPTQLYNLPCLDGNSGSPVISMGTGAAVGLLKGTVGHDSTQVPGETEGR